MIQTENGSSYLWDFFAGKKTLEHWKKKEEEKKGHP